MLSNTVTQTHASLCSITAMYSEEYIHTSSNTGNYRYMSLSCIADEYIKAPVYVGTNMEN